MSKIAVTICTGKVGRGNKVHYLYRGKHAICGAGKCSTGYRFSSASTLLKEQVNCNKCLKAVEHYRLDNNMFSYIIED